jgi:hypothetical protein
MNRSRLLMARPWLIAALLAVVLALVGLYVVRTRVDFRSPPVVIPTDSPASSLARRVAWSLEIGFSETWSPPPRPASALTRQSPTLTEQ